MKMKPYILLTLVLSVMFTGAVRLSAADAPKTDDASVLRELHIQVKTSRIKNLGDSQTIIVPTVYLKLPVAGKVMAIKQTSGFSLFGGGHGNTVRASAHYSVTGLDKEFAQLLAKKVYDDFVSKLRAIGYTVKTYDDIKDLDTVKDIKREEPDATWGLPLEKNRVGNDVCVVAAPSDE